MKLLIESVLMLSNSEEVKLMNHATLTDRLCETPVCELQPGSIYLLFKASTSRCHPPPLIDIHHVIAL